MNKRRRDSVISPEEAMQVCDNVFVYGTLKYNCGNDGLLRSASFMGTVTTVQSFALGDIGFPYAFPFSVVPLSLRSRLCWPVRGEMYELHSPETLRSLDSLEGFPSHYDRMVVELSNGRHAWMYVQDDWDVASYCEACTYQDGEWVWER